MEDLLSDCSPATVTGVVASATLQRLLTVTVRSPGSRQREALYIEFVDEAARLYGDALGHQKDEVADLVKIYALIGRIRLVSPRPVVTAAERTLDTISQTYLAPNRTLHEVMEDFHRGGSDFFAEFGEACRQDLGLD